MEVNIRNLRIGDLLKEYGYVNDQQISEAIEYQKEHKNVRLGGALVELGYIQESQMLQALGERIGIPVIELGNEDVQMEAVELIPMPLAEKYDILAIRVLDGALRVALNDPMNFYGIEDIRQVTGMQLEQCLCSSVELKKAIHYYYSEIEARKAAEQANLDFKGIEVEEISVADEDDDTPIINLLNRLINRAYSTNTSDIHIEPFEKNTVVRMRMDGVMVDYVTLEKSLHQSLIARIKILGNMDIAERRIPQDGHFRMRVEAGDFVNLRVSVLPTVFGEKAVLRLLANNAAIDYPRTFGMDDVDFNKVQRMLKSPNGIIYFTGPTGSGKTTTLYMILESLSNRPVNISTIEDPVEKNLPKINQSQVNNQAGLTFESGLRALLRQDPDIIMVGETRDGETASISVRAAITGHLVFSTLHTNDAVSSIARLEDMGLAPYMVSSSLVGIVAQRLMRKVCPECAEERMATDEEAALLGHKKIMLKHVKGCPACNFTGYRGRIAIHEILNIDTEIRKMINNQVSMEEILEYAIHTQNMKTLKDSGIELVEKGVTTMEELQKVTYYA